MPDAPTLPVLDIHQHLWTEGFLTELRARRAAPYLDDWTLHLSGEPPSDLQPELHDPRLRVQALRTSGQRVVIAHSSPLGVEDLPRRESRRLLDALQEGFHDLRDLEEPVGWWAALPRETAEAGSSTASQRELGRLLDAGAVGLQIPAPWFAEPDHVIRLRPLLAQLQEADRPLFVHPGLVPSRTSNRAAYPAWWAPVVDYGAQMATSWWAWQVAGRPSLPRLRVCFAAGAGLAPLHHERLSARGGRTPALDPWTFVELSGYGIQVFDALLRVLGIDPLISASDRPYAEALEIPHDPAANRAIRALNPQRFLTGGTP